MKLSLYFLSISSFLFILSVDAKVKGNTNSFRFGHAKTGVKGRKGLPAVAKPKVLSNPLHKLIAAKKAIALAPLKLVKAKMLAVPMVAGAAVGAPVGAVIGAKVGAVKGAILAKGLVLKKLGLVRSAVAAKAGLAKKLVIGKLGLIKKAAMAKASLAKYLLLKKLGLAKAVVVKPIVLLAGAKANALAVKKALIAKNYRAKGAIANKFGVKGKTVPKSSKGQISIKKPQLVARFNPLPLSKISLPKIQIPTVQKKIPLPMVQRKVQLPTVQRKIQLPTVQKKIQPTQIKIPLPIKNKIPLPAQKKIPVQQKVEIPQQKVEIPQQKVEIPQQKVEAAHEEIEFPFLSQPASTPNRFDYDKYEIPVVKGPEERVEFPFLGQQFGQLGTSNQYDYTTIREKRETAPTIEVLSGGPHEAEVNRLLNLVDQNNAQACLERVICDLSDDPDTYGEKGREFSVNLRRLQNVRNPRAAAYQVAERQGRSYGNCETRYPQSGCPLAPNQVITLGLNMF